MATLENKPLTYKEAGVDIDEGARLVDLIKPFAKATARAGSDAGLGGFAAAFDLKAAGFKDPLILTTTDGVGTKLKVSIEAGRPERIGIDLVAMCVNDLIANGAEPLVFLDYFATAKLNADDAAIVIKGIAEGCRQAGLRARRRRNGGDAWAVCAGRLRSGGLFRRRGRTGNAAAAA